MTTPPTDAATLPNVLRPTARPDAFGADSALHRARNALERMASLSPREFEVMAMLGGGASSKQVAFDLGISPRTVEEHRARLMKKLDCSSLIALGRVWEAALQAAARLDIADAENTRLS